ncbi:Uncharacterised protein at_DN2464 [Pycnogonum litorale]
MESTKRVHELEYKNLVSENDLLYMLPDVIRKEIFFVGRYVKAYKMVIVTRTGNVYEITRMPQLLVGAIKSTSVVNKLTFTFVEEMSGKMVYEVRGNQWCCHAATRNNAIISRLHSHRCDVIPYHSVVEFQDGIKHFRPLGKQSVAVVTEAGQLYHVGNGNESRMEIGDLKVVGIDSGCLAAAAWTETDDVIFWTEFSAPKARIIRDQQCGKVKKVTVHLGCVYVLYESGSFLVCDNLKCSLLTYSLYAERTSAYCAGDANSCPNCSADKETLHDSMATWSEDVRNEIEEMHRGFLETRRLPDCRRLNLVEILPSKVIDVRRSSMEILVLCQDGTIWRWTPRRDENDVLLKIEPEMTDYNDWMQMLVEEQIQYPVEIIHP